MYWDWLSFESGNVLSERWSGQRFRTNQLLGAGEWYRVCCHGFLWRNHGQCPFHGDLVLCDGDLTLVARLYSGSLEWVRRLEEMSVTQQSLLAIAARQYNFQHRYAAHNAPTDIEPSMQEMEEQTCRHHSGT